MEQRVKGAKLLSVVMSLAGIIITVLMVYGVITFFAGFKVHTVNTYNITATIVESFRTTDRYGGNEYFLMWEDEAGHSDIMQVCSTCYAKYYDCATVPMLVKDVESKHMIGTDFFIHTHGNYQRGDK